VVVYPDPRVPEQHACGFFRGARHRRVVPHQILRDRAVDEKGELGRERVCVGHMKLHQEVAEPDAAAFLEGDRNLFDGAIIRAQFG
jgi:hypothetical protein